MKCIIIPSHPPLSFPVTPRDIRSNPIALRKAKIVYSFGLSECNRVKMKGGQTHDSQ